MARNRIIYQSEALFASNWTGAAGSAGTIAEGEVVNLQRVTEISNNAEITRQNVNVFGQLANISREIIEEPTVSMDFTYYLADGFNESGIGFSLNNSASCLSGILSNEPLAQKNFYVLTVKEGSDANNTEPQQVDAQQAVIGIGNAFLTNYSVNASVGEIPSATVSVEASNITFDASAAAGTINPAIDLTAANPDRLTGLVSLPTADTGNLNVKVLRPGDITLLFDTESLDMGGAVLPGMTTAATKTAAHIQSFTLDLPLSRTPLRRLGNAFAFSRELDVPIDVTLSVSANLADIDAGSLNDLICAVEAKRDITIKLYEACQGGNESFLNMQFLLKNATLDSQNMSSTIGDSKTVDLTFTSQISGPNDTANGVQISGKV